MEKLNEIKVKIQKYFIRNKTKVVIFKSIIVLVIYSLLSYYTELQILELITAFLLYKINK